MAKKNFATSEKVLKFENTEFYEHPQKCIDRSWVTEERYENTWMKYRLEYRKKNASRRNLTVIETSSCTVKRVRRHNFPSVLRSFRGRGLTRRLSIDRDEFHDGLLFNTIARLGSCRTFDVQRNGLTHGRQPGATLRSAIANATENFANSTREATLKPTNRRSVTVFPAPLLAYGFYVFKAYSELH